MLKDEYQTITASEIALLKNLNHMKHRLKSLFSTDIITIYICLRRYACFASTESEGRGKQVSVESGNLKQNEINIVKEYYMFRAGVYFKTQKCD